MGSSDRDLLDQARDGDEQVLAQRTAMLTTVTSTALLEGLRQQDNDEVWRQFCARYEPVLLTIVGRAGFCEEDAADVVQETLMAFLEAFRGGKYDRERGRLQSWLRGIALNKIREARRRLAKRGVQVVDQTDGTGFMNRVPDVRELTDVFSEEWERGVMAECLRQVGREVDEQTFQAFRLYALEDQPAEQVAERLGVSRNTVYISKSRVLSRLRQLQHEVTQIW